MPNRHTLLAFVFAALMLLGASRSESAIISVGPFPELNPSPAVVIPAGAFLVPVQISGAVNLQNWQFDLLFDQNVVQVVLEPSPTLIPGIFAAEFSPGDANSLSNITSGFPFFPGLVDDVAGSHPFLLNGATGDGVLAYIMFEFLPGQNTNNPDFRVEGSVQQQEAPEPGTLALFAAALLILAFTRRRLSPVRLPS